MKIVIPGPPIAKKRPRFARRGKHVATINDQVTEEGRWILQAREQLAGRLFSGALTVKLSFFMPRPASHYRSKAGVPKGELKAAYSEICHTKKPDLDNLIKFALDCLNGTAWADDAAVVSLVASKEYCSLARLPRTEIWID